MMEAAKHTPGPWDIYEVRTHGGLQVHVGRKRATVAHVWSQQRRDANAHLIAAAPDYDAAAREAVDFLAAYFGPVEDEHDRTRWSDDDAFTVWRALSAAIAKATGGSHER